MTASASIGDRDPLRATKLLRLFEVARGGMGSVYVALRREGRFERLYAVKRPHPHLREDPSFRAMFLDEARVAGLLRHPNVVSVLDVGEDEEGPYLVMDYVEGVSFARLIERIEPRTARLPLALCLSVVAQVARGLHAAHELCGPDGAPLGLVHRDVSPQNILVGYDGAARVTDFGIAKALGNLSQTTTGLLKGNVGYMSPEQLGFQDPDRRSDLFSLGVVLFEALSRARLYPNEDGHKSARRILDEPPPDIVEQRLDVPPEVAGLLFELLAKDRADRPADAAQVAARLETVLVDLQGQSGPFDLAGYVGQHFATEQEERKRRIAEASAAVEVAATGAEAGTSGPDATTRRRPRLHPAWMGAGAVLATGVAILALIASRDARPGPVWAGNWHTCALRGDGLWCWGKNNYGQAGTGGTHDLSRAKRVHGIGAVAWVDGGAHHTCAVTPTGALFCWGRNEDGQLGLRERRTMFERPEPVPGLTDVLRVEAGDDYTCALRRSARVFCWGRNEFGRLGDGVYANPEKGDPIPSREQPVEVMGIREVAGIAAGLQHACAHTRSGRVFCWGRNASGQLGNRTLEDSPRPVAVEGIEDAVQVTAGRSFTCARRRSGRVACWGGNSLGQLGNGVTGEPRPFADDVIGLDQVVALGAGSSFNCALRRAGSVHCWGRGEWGNIGDGSHGIRSTPSTAKDVTEAVALAVGANHACARLKEGGVTCWGNNETGQLGDGSHDRKTRPISAIGFP